MAGEDLRIEVARSGGFAGMTSSAQVEGVDLSDEEAAEFERLLSRLETLRSGLPGAGGADRFEYDITVERGGRRQHVTVGDGDLTREERALLKRLLGRGR